MEKDDFNKTAWGAILQSPVLSAIVTLLNRGSLPASAVMLALSASLSAGRSSLRTQSISLNSLNGEFHEWIARTPELSDHLWGVVSGNEVTFVDEGVGYERADDWKGRRVGSAFHLDFMDRLPASHGAIDFPVSRLTPGSELHIEFSDQQGIIGSLVWVSPEGDRVFLLGVYDGGLQQTTLSRTRSAAQEMYFLFER